MPNETQTRIALLYTSAATGGAFSGILAYGIAKMDGVGGYEGWRWVSSLMLVKEPPSSLYYQPPNVGLLTDFYY